MKRSEQAAPARLRQTDSTQPCRRTPEGLLISQRVLLVLVLLKDAQDYAQELDRSIWDFAVEISELRALGLTNSDLRWLVCKGLVDHGTDVTQPGEQARTFQSGCRLVFHEKTCFVLTQAGARFLSDLTTRSSELDGVANSVQARNGVDVHETLKPRWDRERQELRVGHVVVKRFKVPAVSQQTVLAAFEEEGWPPHIYDPLAQSPNQNHKRRLHDTINSLNRNQKHQLIHFSGNGNGEGICWELVQSADTEHASYQSPGPLK